MKAVDNDTKPENPLKELFGWSKSKGNLRKALDEMRKEKNYESRYW